MLKEEILFFECRSTGDSNAPKYVLFEECIQKLQGFEVLLIDDSKLK